MGDVPKADDGTSGYDAEAQAWAVSPEGQLAIERRGGRSVIRKLLDEARVPRPLQIRRCDS